MRSTTQSAPCVTWCRTTSCRWLRCWPWSRRSVRMPTPCATRRSRCSRPWPPPTPAVRARAVRRLPRRARCRGRLHGRDLRGCAPRDRLVAVGRRALRVRAGKGLTATALEAVIEFQAPPRLLFSPDGCQPHPNHLRFRLGHHDGVTLGLQAKEPGERLVSRPVGLDSTSSTSSAPATRPTKGSSATPWKVTRAALPGRTAWRPRGGSSSRSWTSPVRSTATRAARGDRRQPTRSSPTAMAGTLQTSCRRCEGR